MKEWDGTMMGREAHTCDSWSFGIVIGHGLGRTNGGSAPGRCSSHCTYKLPDLYVTWAFINIWICLSRFSVKFNVTVDLFLHYKRHPTTQIHFNVIKIVVLSPLFLPYPQFHALEVETPFHLLFPSMRWEDVERTICSDKFLEPS